MTSKDADSRLTVRMPVKLARELDEFARTHDLTMSQVFRKMARLVLAKPELLNDVSDETLARAK
jgi:metal-responsive CopG/Arc/MetJ family transcriptional regulator